jgi:hypothetical protein
MAMTGARIWTSIPIINPKEKRARKGWSKFALFTTTISQELPRGPSKNSFILFEDMFQ